MKLSAKFIPQRLNLLDKNEQCYPSLSLSLVSTQWIIKAIELNWARRKIDSTYFLYKYI